MKTLRENYLLLQPVEVKAEKLGAEYTAMLEDQSGATKEAAKWNEEQKEQLASLQDELDPVRKLTREYHENLELLDAAKQANAISDQEYSSRVRELGDQFNIAKQKAQGFTDTASAMASEWERASRPDR
ncbi:MAG: hypothetical protein U5O39_00405 [Gammaproteobacteria bacterium]|nr:hypothetical protein [Gammaproteobacteria bacterium]